MGQGSDVIAKSANFISAMLIEVSYIRQGSNYCTPFGTCEFSGEFWAPNLRKDAEARDTLQNNTGKGERFINFLRKAWNNFFNLKILIQVGRKGMHRE